MLPIHIWQKKSSPAEPKRTTAFPDKRHIAALLYTACGGASVTLADSQC